MDVNKNCIHMNKMTGKLTQNITLDEDFNLGEKKDDIVGKIHENGYVVIEKCAMRDEKVVVGGFLCFTFLYASENGYDSYSSKIPFEEAYAFYDAGEGDVLRCDACVMDLSTSVINSRKIDVKAIVSIEVTASCINDETVVDFMDIENLQVKTNRLDVLQLVVSKKDTVRVRESMNIPREYPNIDNVLWYELTALGVETRPMEGYVDVRGSMCIAGIYCGEDGKRFSISNMVPFTGKVELPECLEKLPVDIIVSTNDKSLIVRQDANGEMRIIDAEMILALDIRVYDERQYEILNDAYSPNYELELVGDSMEYDRFVLKNILNCRLEKTFDVPQPNIVNVLSCTGKINVDEMNYTEKGVEIEGAVTADIIYLSSDGNYSFARYEMPFEEKLDVPHMDEKYMVNVRPGSMSVTASLKESGNVSIKTDARIEFFVTEKAVADVVREVNIEAPDYDRIKKLPGIAGYITRDGDTLWDIAKKYCTTMSKIMEDNDLSSENLVPGLKLVLIKMCK